MKPLIEAIELATQAHGKQIRKYSGRPYIEHPIRVMCKLYRYASAHQNEYLGWTPMVVLPAAICHDVLEDTPVTYKELSDKLGPAVASLVDELTKKEDVSLPRAERKKKEIERLSGVSEEAKLIKLLDRQDNLEDVLKYGGPAEWALKYIIESRLLLVVIGSKHPSLRNDIIKIIDQVEFKYNRENDKDVYGEPPLKQLIREYRNQIGMFQRRPLDGNTRNG